MASPRDPARLRRGLHPLTTSALARPSAQPNTPLSAVSMTPSRVLAATPASAIQPYNPQEWVSSPAPASAPAPDRPPHLRPDAQAPPPPLPPPPPPPPPPYSPPRSRRQRPVSTTFEHAVASASMPLPGLATPSMQPQPPASHAFPPPPGLSGRGSSRERRFGLPSLGRRRDHDHQPSGSPDPQPRATQPPALPAAWTMEPLASARELGRVASPPAMQQPGPPAARRAASTGAIGSPAPGRSRSTSQTRWEPGMPLPPPPPGPPPPSESASQSVQGADRNSIPVPSPPTRRPKPAAAAVSSLGPVPPTPADWVDDGGDPGPGRPDRGRLPGLTIDTVAAARSQDVPGSLGSSPPSAGGGLSRTRAVRHDKTIMQRRAESRSRNSSQGPHRNISDIVVPEDHGLAARPTPWSGGVRAQPGLPRTGELSGGLQQDSRNSTPRAPGLARLSLETATPPFSPYHPPAKADNPPQSVAPKALPTPPPQTRSTSSSRPRDASRPPASAAAGPVPRHLVVAQTAEQFAAAAVERFRAFAAKEAAAPTDADRVRMFADLIVSESRIRRERYSSAIGAMGSEILDLTRDLFRPMTAPSREPGMSQEEEWTPASSSGPNALQPRDSTRGTGTPSSAPASAGLPASSPSSGGGTPAANTNWAAANYMPSLSPILSMSVSDNHDNGSSRGRPSSRWWESDSQGDPSRMLGRTRRESKYMGVPKDQWVAGDGQDGEGGVAAASEHGSSSGYPPEKTGWHDEEEEPSWTPQPLRLSAAAAGLSPPSPSLRRPEALDVSRLVTMLPPYPRHHPAVNNSHPELAAMRSSVRALADLTEVDDAKERFAMASSRRRDEFARAESERRQSLKANLQREIGAGNLGYADAAAIEAHSQDEERGRAKELDKAEYEHFQSAVVLPLNELLTGRIARAGDLFDDLARHLFDDDGRTDADMPQEEGDDRPELLEKLTLLKWIFETREALHRAVYDMLSARNGRYREVVVAPYRLAGNRDKAESAEAFFAEDAARREHAYAGEALERAHAFRDVVEEAVERGVALQLSAFWDIAPPLRQLLDSIPADLVGFGVRIPPAELAENPSYGQHPLQYLYSLLQHAEKSTYQFIESHANLLCLLHEVRGAVVRAEARVLAADATAAGAEEREARAEVMRQGEDRRLTEDLKDKVRVVQDQWSSALGDGIRSVKERAGAWLLQTGGWDETLEEAGLGCI